MFKKVEDNTFRDNILNNLHNDIEDIINKKMELLQEKSVSSLEKVQTIYYDELKTLRKELKYKTQIINKLTETIENIINKSVQPNPQVIPEFYFENESNETNESDRRNQSTRNQ